MQKWREGIFICLMQEQRKITKICLYPPPPLWNSIPKRYKEPSRNIYKDIYYIYYLLKAYKKNFQDGFLIISDTIMATLTFN